MPTQKGGGGRELPHLVNRRRPAGHPLDRDTVWSDPTGELVVLPDPCSIRGQAARAWLDTYLADNEGPDGLLNHERTRLESEAA